MPSSAVRTFYLPLAALAEESGRVLNPTMDSITDKRRAQILERLRRQEPVRVAELSRHFGVSEVSIRRDMRHLEQRGLLKRVHGGAVPVADTSPYQPPQLALDPNNDKKQRIGKAAGALISHGDCLIFDSGSTPWHVAVHIPENLLNSGNLTVITASLPIVRQLGACRGLQLIVLGGIYLPESEAMAGPQTIENLKGLHAEKMFLGTDGLSFSNGLTTTNVFEAEVERAMLRATSQVIVVADSSKIGGTALATLMPLTSIDKLITDTDAPADFVAQLRGQGVEVIVV